MKPWTVKKRMIKAWIKKKLGIVSPSSGFAGRIKKERFKDE